MTPSAVTFNANKTLGTRGAPGGQQQHEPSLGSGDARDQTSTTLDAKFMPWAMDSYIIGAII